MVPLEEDGSPLYIDTVAFQGNRSVNTTYMHSRYYIENVLLPDYEMLMALETENSAEFDSFKVIIIFSKIFLRRTRLQLLMLLQNQKFFEILD